MSEPKYKCCAHCKGVALNDHVGYGGEVEKDAHTTWCSNCNYERADVPPTQAAPPDAPRGYPWAHLPSHKRQAQDTTELSERGLLYRLHDLLQGICTTQPCESCASGGGVALYDREADDRVEQALDLIEAGDRPSRRCNDACYGGHTHQADCALDGGHVGECVLGDPSQARCAIPCDKDCEQTCHAEHLPSHKRQAQDTTGLSERVRKAVDLVRAMRPATDASQLPDPGMVEACARRRGMNDALGVFAALLAPADAPRDEPVDSHWVTRPYPMNPEYVVMTCTICPGYSTGRGTPGSSRLNEAVRQHDAAKHPVPRAEPGLAERVWDEAVRTVANVDPAAIHNPYRSV